MVIWPLKHFGIRFWIMSSLYIRRQLSHRSRERWLMVVRYAIDHVGLLHNHRSCIMHRSLFGLAVLLLTPAVRFSDQQPTGHVIAHTYNTFSDKSVVAVGSWVWNNLTSYLRHGHQPWTIQAATYFCLAHRGRLLRLGNVLTKILLAYL